MAEAETEVKKEFLPYDGPKAGVKYPLKVVYCGGESFIINIIPTSHLYIHFTQFDWLKSFKLKVASSASRD